MPRQAGGQHRRALFCTRARRSGWLRRSYRRPLRYHLAMARSSALLLVLAGVCVGCGDDETGGGGGTDDTQTDTGTATQTSTGSDTGTETSTGTDTGTSTETSTATSTDTSTGCWETQGQACLDCCTDNNAPGVEFFDETFIELCLCGPDAPCLMDCSGDCPIVVAADVGAACAACVSTPATDACILETLELCLADPSCTQWFDCQQGCPD